MFDGLYGYEKVMLVLGAVFFVMLAALLMLQIVRKQPYGALLLFFAIPIAMMGYSGIQSIGFQNGTVTIDKYTQQLQESPTDANVRANLKQQVASLASRPAADPQTLTQFARAQFALGKGEEAEATLAKALKASPELAEAKKLQQHIQLDHDVTSLTGQLAAKPADRATKQELQAAVDKAGRLKISNPDFLTHLASAHAALGNRPEALALAATALKIKPDMAAAQRLARQMQAAHS